VRAVSSILPRLGRRIPRQLKVASGPDPGAHSTRAHPTRTRTDRRSHQPRATRPPRISNGCSDHYGPEVALISMTAPVPTEGPEGIRLLRMGSRSDADQLRPSSPSWITASSTRA